MEKFVVNFMQVEFNARLPLIHGLNDVQILKTATFIRRFDMAIA